MDEEGEDEDGKASNSSGDSIDKILREMGEDDPPAPGPVTGSHSKDPVGPGDGVTAPECFWPFQCPCMNCYYMMNPSDPAADGPAAFTPYKWDQDGRNVRPRLDQDGPKPRQPDL